MSNAVASLASYPLVEELFDEDGFLLELESWNEDLAMHIAVHDGIGQMNDDHWRVISYLRERYKRVGGLPLMRHVCRATSLNRHQIHSMFGGCGQAWRIAGLPNPGEEAKSYF